MIGPVYHVVRDPAQTRPTLTAAEAIDATQAFAGVEARRAPPIPGPRDRATLVRFPTQGATRLAWATITTISPSRIDRAVIDAASGRVLWRENLVKADQPGSGLAWPHAPFTAPAQRRRRAGTRDVPGRRSGGPLRQQRARLHGHAG